MCYAGRFFGMMVAAPLSTYLYSSSGPQGIVICLSCAPLLPAVSAFYLSEETPTKLLTAYDRCHDIWITVKSRSVWQPMTFVFCYNLLQVSNGAWRQFLKTDLHFTESQLNCLLTVAYTLLFLGTIIYKQCFLGISWRVIYQVSIVCTGILSALQLLLIKGNTFGVSPFFFALGDDAAAELIKGIQYLVSPMHVPYFTQSCTPHYPVPTPQLFVFFGVSSLL